MPKGRGQVTLRARSCLWGKHGRAAPVGMVPAGAALYVGGSVLFKVDSFRYIWEIVQKILHRGKEETA